MGERSNTQNAAEDLLNAPDVTETDVVSVLPFLEVRYWDDVEQQLLKGAQQRAIAGNDLLQAFAGIYLRKGKLDDARATLERETQARPSAGTLVELARIANAQKDHEGALGYLAHARDLEPQNANIHFFFGVVCVKENLIGEAYRSLKQAVSLAPDNAQYNYASGMLAQQRADPSEAIPFFKRYSALRPHDPRGRLELGISYFESHQEILAQRELEGVVRNPETAASAHFFLARNSERGRQVCRGPAASRTGAGSGRHCNPGATHRMAAFAFKLAREATGKITASYRPGGASRKGLMLNPGFRAAFNAKARIRYREETDQNAQALLEIYCTTALNAKYNDFNTH